MISTVECLRYKGYQARGNQGSMSLGGKYSDREQGGFRGQRAGGILVDALNRRCVKALRMPGKFPMGTKTLHGSEVWRNLPAPSSQGCRG